jgi:hypothetical protein
LTLADDRENFSGSPRKILFQFYTPKTITLNECNMSDLSNCRPKSRTAASGRPSPYLVPLYVSDVSERRIKTPLLAGAQLQETYADRKELLRRIAQAAGYAGLRRFRFKFAAQRRLYQSEMGLLDRWYRPLHLYSAVAAGSESSSRHLPTYEREGCAGL